MIDLADPVVLRGVERDLIAVGGILFGYLGYRLFRFGVTEGVTNLSTESRFVKLVFSGSAPGLFFMLCGAGILIVGLYSGGAETSDVERRIPINNISQPPRTKATPHLPEIVATAPATTSAQSLPDETTMSSETTGTMTMAAPSTGVRVLEEKKKTKKLRK